jgi:hypothetical protein
VSARRHASVRAPPTTHGRALAQTQCGESERAQAWRAGSPVRLASRPRPCQGWQGRSGSLTSAPRPATPGEISAPRPATPNDPAQATTPPWPSLPARPGTVTTLRLKCIRKQLQLRARSQHRAALLACGLFDHTTGAITSENWTFLDWLVRTIQIHTTAMVRAAGVAGTAAAAELQATHWRHWWRTGAGGVTGYTVAASRRRRAAAPVEDRSRRTSREPAA